MSSNSSASEQSSAGQSADGSHFAPTLLYTAAKLYYDEEATQAEVAAKLGTSRATVSRLLSEARRQGIVRIKVIPPEVFSHEDLADRLATALRLDHVFLSAPLPPSSPSKPTVDLMGRYLAPAVSKALHTVGLGPGDILLVSSGRTVYEVAQFDLDRIPGVLVAPTVGGNDQPEEWYQTNEITRLIANKLGGRAHYLFAPALPGADLYAIIHSDPAIQRVLELWPQARCILMGVGAPPLLRADIPRFVPTDSASLRDSVGDVCSRFYDKDGNSVEFPGSDRLIAVDLAALPKIPVGIAVAVGSDKVTPIVVGARARFFNQLVTDPATAQEVLASIATDQTKDSR
ncbi:sugar-binding domain-containing protein [Rhodococcus sp. G-MC3]|uniref:sugar-binding transcriptional regulator n=1 Tax=Rhodococcus sp. G-MC3 TaxID=3046209 RepID=UPI0024BAEB32|nr:sugar-binding domain-containing protein [Rhodococcus sp. G-MC3]MDJ0395739.1 sugar-binding domain-containing protein [Rhodococcus sp. G-MC3]